MSWFPSPAKFEKIEPKFPVGSLIYVSDFGFAFRKTLKNRWECPSEEFRVGNLILDKRLTETAKN